MTKHLDYNVYVYCYDALAELAGVMVAEYLAATDRSATIAYYLASTTDREVALRPSPPTPTLNVDAHDSGLP